MKGIDENHAAVANLMSSVMCRDREMKQLLELFGYPDEPVPQSLFIYGQKSSGKSYILCKLFESLEVNHAIVDCVEGYIPRLIYESIISQLVGDSTFSSSRCDDMMEFINLLNKAASNDEHFQEQVNVIVLEGSERLRDMTPTILPALMYLQELTQLHRVCVVFVSNIVWDKFSPAGGLAPPIQIFFPQYTQDILKILFLDRPEKYPGDFYRNYLQLFVSVFLRSCRDIRELRYKAKVNFQKYCEPVEKGEIDINDSQKLWRLIAPHFKASLQVIYMRMEVEEGHLADSSVSSSVDMKGCEPAPIVPVDRKTTLSSSAKFALSFELPYYAKYFLIAAYLASYNSPKEDKKLFVKLSGRTKKKVPKQQKNSQAKLSSQMIGPRQFDMERLLAIFYSILDEKPHISANLLTQITTLVELQLLSKVGEDPLDGPKYKCVVGLDFIVTIAKTLSFNVTKYLVDYK